MENNDITDEMYAALLASKWTYNCKSVRLSYSGCQTMQSCPRKFEFSKMYVTPVYESSWAAMSGQCVHTGIQSYMASGDLDKAMFDMMLEYNWDAHISPLDNNSIETCYAVVKKMASDYDRSGEKLAWIEGKDGIAVPAVEVPFRITFTGYDLKVPSKDGKELRSVDLSYVGFIDAIMRDKYDDSFFVKDFKTTRRKVDDITAKYAHSDQCVPYALVIARILGEPLDSLRVQYHSILMDVTNPEVDVLDYYKSADDIEDWARTMMVQLRNLQLYSKLAWFPRNGSACQAFAKRCSYFEECGMKRESMTDIQNSLMWRRGTVAERPFEPLIEIELNLEALNNE